MSLIPGNDHTHFLCYEFEWVHYIRAVQPIRFESLTSQLICCWGLRVPECICMVLTWVKVWKLAEDLQLSTTEDTPVSVPFSWRKGFVWYYISSGYHFPYNCAQGIYRFGAMQRLSKIFFLVMSLMSKFTSCKRRCVGLLDWRSSWCQTKGSNLFLVTYFCSTCLLACALHWEAFEAALLYWIAITITIRPNVLFTFALLAGTAREEATPTSQLSG